MTKKIIFSTGGTGGHVLPAINLMKHFHLKGYSVLLVTDNRGSNFLRNYPEFKFYVLKTDTPTKKNYLRKLISLCTIFFSIIRSILILKKEKPNLVFGFGGYVSFPISFASKFFNLPLFIYENNMILGKTNNFLLGISKKIFTAHEINKKIPEKFKNKIFQVGPILTKDIINSSKSIKKEKKSITTISVFGGSQGAEIFGKIVPPVIKMLKEEGHKIEINQQCFKGQKNQIMDYYEENKINNNVFEFNKNISEIMLSTDLAISRCGASTTAELVYTATPFIAVPLPTSIDNHQYINAKHYESKGCCWLLEEKNFNTKNLFNLIKQLIHDKKKFQNICTSIKKNHFMNAYENIDKKITEFIKNEN